VNERTRHWIMMRVVCVCNMSSVWIEFRVPILMDLTYSLKHCCHILSISTWIWHFEGRRWGEEVSYTCEKPFAGTRKIMFSLLKSSPAFFIHTESQHLSRTMISIFNKNSFNPSNKTLFISREPSVLHLSVVDKLTKRDGACKPRGFANQKSKW